MDSWRYENFGLVSNCSPHIEPDLSIIKDKWTSNRPEGSRLKPLYLKWTDKFDCGYETEWWYLIKDDVFDISSLKAKRRYEINKGNKNFLVQEIDPKLYLDDINRIRELLFRQYPDEYKKENNVDKTNKMYNVTQNNAEWITVGAFSRITNRLCGYADINIKEGYLDFVRMCVDPSCEKDGINFALVNGVLVASNSFIDKGFYICDGQRSIRHKTAFQEWLVKYFNFRYAYCRLNIKYSRLGKFLYVIGRHCKKLLESTKSRTLYKFFVYVKMGEIAESFLKPNKEETV